MSVVKQLDKRSGITYAYESVSHWDKEKKQSRSIRKLIGRSIAYFLILEEINPLFRFGRWERLHRHPYGGDIASQRSSEFFASITEEQKQAFFRLQGRRRVQDEYWAYDSTSISSYSECLSQVRHGKNKDDDRLPQINLLLIFGEKSNLPFYYRKLAGNIPDVKAVRVLLRDLDVLGYPKVKLVTDRGFYSKDNANGLYQHHVKFLMSASTSLSFVKKAIESVGDTIRDWSHYNDKYDLYTHRQTMEWDYTQIRPYKGDTLMDGRRMYLHLYFNAEQAVEDGRKFNRRMTVLRDELLSGKRNAKHEKGFGNIKERLNSKRMLVSSDASLEGKLFVEFVALIFLSYIKKQMGEKNLFRQYTLQGLLDEVDLIECFSEPGKSLCIGEVLQKQRQIFKDMDVPSPDAVDSLC